jgi:hypothetical protein
MKMNPLSLFMKINWSASPLRIFDYLLGVAALLWGLYSGNMFWFWVGVAALIFAFINPMGRLQGGVRGFFKPASKK